MIFWIKIKRVFNWFTMVSCPICGAKFDPSELNDEEMMDVLLACEQCRREME